MSETAKKGRQVIYEYLEQIGCPIYEGHYQFKLKKLLIDYAREECEVVINSKKDLENKIFILKKQIRQIERSRVSK